MKMKWMKPNEKIGCPYIVLYRNEFVLENGESFQMRFSADERCQIFIDGQRVADGPERGDIHHWHYREISITSQPGRHTVVSRVVCFGKKITAHGQQSIAHGFAAESAQLKNNWQWQKVEGCSYLQPKPDWGAYPRHETDLSYNWNGLNGDGGMWKDVEPLQDMRELHAPELPPMLYEPEHGYRVQKKDGKMLVVFDEYVCVWSEFVFSGKGHVRLRWAETLYEDNDADPYRKGNRRERDGKVMRSEGSLLQLPGGRQCRWVDSWWKAGMFLEITLDGDAALEEMNFYRTGYPYRIDRPPQSDDPKEQHLLDMSLRTLQACSHETHMDCPYYEQMMYVGDTRIQILCAYTLTDERRLARKALRMMARSQREDGMISSRWPSKQDQTICSFALIYVLTLHDYWQWNDDAEFMRELLPVAQNIITHFCQRQDEHGLVTVEGWNFIDWVDGWQDGTPPNAGQSGCSLNWFFVLALNAFAELEESVGSVEQACVYRQQAQETQAGINRVYLNPSTGLYTEDREQTYSSEHAQVLSMIATGNTEDKIVDALRQSELPECGLYFSFYYLYACRKCGLGDLFTRRLKVVAKLADEGLSTFPENERNPRSDCHAWSAYYLYFYETGDVNPQNWEK